MRNLEIYSREQKQMLLQKKKDMIQDILSGSRKAFRELPEKTAFMKQFESIRSRYKFLVLCGNSGTGKTWFCKYITGNPDECLEVNCANCPEPDLRAFDPFVHKAVLFDEASPSMVLAQKKVVPVPACRGVAWYEHNQLPLIQNLRFWCHVRHLQQHLDRRCSPYAVGRRP